MECILEGPGLRFWDIRDPRMDVHVYPLMQVHAHTFAGVHACAMRKLLVCSHASRKHAHAHAQTGRRSRVGRPEAL
jgi:hypothetical protein